LASEDRALELAATTSITPAQADPILKATGGAAGAALPHAVKLIELAKRQGVSLAHLFAATGVGGELHEESIITAELELKYAGYFERERMQAARLRKLGEFALASDLPYEDMRSMSVES